MYKHYREMYESIHFDHDVKVYVPVWETRPGEPSPIGDGDFHESYPSFVYKMEYATMDEQMAWSMEPDYVLELTGRFNAKTKPWFNSDIYWTHGNGD